MSDLETQEGGRVCLVLGGGGARGLSHLGVLKVLDREGVPVDCIIGTSAGAVVGAAYALQPDAAALAESALEYFNTAGGAFRKVLLKSEDAERNFFSNLIASIRKSYVFSALIRRPAIFPRARLEQVIHDLVPELSFGDAQIPFAVPALDIRSGDEILLREGPLREAVIASCSLPGFFPPVERDDMLLVDAGVIGPVPVNAAKCFRADVTIAVDISSQLDPIVDLAQGLDAILRVESIACKRLNDLELEAADVVVAPDVGSTYWSDFSELQQLVEQGERAAEAQLDTILALLQKHGRQLREREPLQR